MFVPKKKAKIESHKVNIGYGKSFETLKETVCKTQINEKTVFIKPKQITKRFLKTQIPNFWFPTHTGPFPIVTVV